jgi:hypothetical protein
MCEHKHFGPVESIEPLNQTCPICETLILRIVHRETDLPDNRLCTYIACDCMAEEDFFEEGMLLLSEDGFHTSIREIWGQEVLYMMSTRPEHFPPGSTPGPVDLS